MNRGDVIVTVNNIIKPTQPLNGKFYELNELQAIVDGLIECVHLGNGRVLVVNEEGKIKGKLPNHIATGWVNASGFHDWIAGDCLLTTEERII